MRCVEYSILNFLEMSNYIIFIFMLESEYVNLRARHTYCVDVLWGML